MDKYFVIKRHNRENDFRASGSKLFDTHFQADELLLDKAEYLKNKFSGSPYLSMDFIFDDRDNDCKLVEYQALHFGVSVIVKNTGYYARQGSWQFVPQVLPIETELALGLAKFLKKE